MHREAWREHVDGQLGSDQVSPLEADVVWKSPAAPVQGQRGHAVMVCMQEPAWVQPTVGSQEPMAPMRTSCLSTSSSQHRHATRVAPPPQGTREGRHL